MEDLTEGLEISIFLVEAEKRAVETFASELVKCIYFTILKNIQGQKPQ